MIMKSWKLPLALILISAIIVPQASAHHNEQEDSQPTYDISIDVENPTFA